MEKKGTKICEKLMTEFFPINAKHQTKAQGAQRTPNRINATSKTITFPHNKVYYFQIKLKHSGYRETKIGIHSALLRSHENKQSRVKTFKCREEKNYQPRFL